MLLLRYLIVIVLIFPLKNRSQVIDETLEWAGIISTVRLNSVTIYSDVQLRWGTSQLKIALLRFGIARKINEPFQLSAGPAVFISNPFKNKSFEFRLWQEAAAVKDFRCVRFCGKFRLEQRWIEIAESRFNFFVRFRFKSEFFLKILKEFNANNGFVFFNELLVQQDGKSKIYWDHDRVGVGIQYYFRKAFGTQLQYILMPFVRQSIGNFNNRQVLRVNLLFDF